MKKILQMLAVVLCLGIMAPSMVKAAETDQEAEITQLSKIMVANEDLEAKEKPENHADVVLTFAKEAPVYVIGETKNGWYQVSYQGIEGYVLQSALREQDLNVEQLNKEMEEVEAESRMVVEEVERYRAEVKRSRIWGTVIVLLVVGIFATGLLSTVRAKKKEENQDPD